MERFSYESTEPMVVQAIRTDTNPTANAVSAILVASGGDVPATTDTAWITGSWQATALQANGLYKTDAWFTLTARAHARGTYDVFVWVDGSTYDPVRSAGAICIY